MSTNLPSTVFTNAEAASLGISGAQLARAVRRGVLRRPLRGVYAPVDWPDDLEHRTLAAARLLRPDQVLVDRSAAWLHGVDAFGFAEREVLPGVETAVLTRRRARRATGVRGRSRDLSADDVMSIGAVRLTTPRRTALDLACNLRRADALACIDALGRLHDLDRADLQVGLVRFAGRRGVIQARQLINLMDPLAESARESHLRLAIIDAGLPVPVLQFVVELDGRVLRLDLAYPASRVAVEYDGQEFHDSTEQRLHDEQRRSLLREAGWTVIVVRSGDFTGARHDAWIQALRNALAERFTTLRW